MISFFEEPVWRHDPGSQLRRIVERNREKIEDKFGRGFVEELKELTEVVDEVSLWHAWSVYGKERDDGEWIPAANTRQRSSSRRQRRPTN
jgi:hypothetical protein